MAEGQNGLYFNPGKGNYIKIDTHTKIKLKKIGVEVPSHVKEGSKLHDLVIALDGMAKYFPSKYAKGRGCDREYMFNITNTIHHIIQNHKCTIIHGVSV